MLDFTKEAANRSNLSMRWDYDAIDFADLVGGC
jgi:hypothetical protein